MKHFKFNNKYMEELLRVITHENKNCILTGDFNLNLLKHAKSPDVSKFLENLLLHNFMPQITLPTRITEKTAILIDNIIINNNVLNCISGNITTSISRSFTSIHCLRQSIRNLNGCRQFSNFI